jgi:hypothetical protein
VHHFRTSCDKLVLKLKEIFLDVSRRLPLSQKRPGMRYEPVDTSSARSYRAMMFVLACVIYAAGRAPFFGQWDSFDYLKQTVTHTLSDLGFGRPVFIGYNVAIWEIGRRLLGLSVLQVDKVIMLGVILAGAVGVVVFSRFTDQLLSGRSARMATIALLLAPMYAVYSGYIMTEVPMLLTLVTGAFILWDCCDRHPTTGALSGGILFGLAVGIREQALTLVAACLWILWVRRSTLRARLQAWLLFGTSALTVIALPILTLYLHDPAWFLERTRIWLHTIPTGDRQFWGNLEASLMFTFLICPGAWLGMAGAGISSWRRKAERESNPEAAAREAPSRIPHPVWGVFCSILLPIAALWRDADVQMHPRYAMIALPGSIVLCVVLYRRWAPSAKAALTWAMLQIAVFGIAQAGIFPLRAIQRQKREFTFRVMEVIPESALIIPGGYSPILDYYRGIGVKPRWHVLWSGWGWDRRTSETAIRKAWVQHQPVYWCSGPYGWLYFEDEWLDLHFIFQDCPREEVAPGIVRVFPRH